MLNAIEENRIIESLASCFLRSPQQLNSRHESDAEIVQLSDDCTLAITTDSLSEEISSGLYSDPYLIGWMLVTANLSDLAAVGAHPTGILISEVLTDSCTEEFLDRMHQGIHEACRKHGTFVLGGDTNYGNQLVLTGTAFGRLPRGRTLCRIGCRPGDMLFSSNYLGRGNAFALATLSGSLGISARNETRKANFQPAARLTEGAMLREFATSCMDTSDGVIATLDQMMRLNHVGFEFNTDWAASLDPWARQIAGGYGIPEWFLLAGQHGEFELLYTIAVEHAGEWLMRGNGNNFHSIPLGRVTPDQLITLPLDGIPVRLDSARIRNCAHGMSGDLREYLHELLVYEGEITKRRLSHAGDGNV